ncbi:MAG: hypothetical protein DMD75_12385, partial [Candidatus Rokuibacteriota bacterium]
FGVLIGVTLIALVLLLAGQLSGQSRLSQLLTDPLRGGPERLPGPPVVAETPPPARPDSETPSAGGSASTSSVSGPSEVTGTVSQEPSIPPKETSISARGASAPANETGSSPQAGTGKGARDTRPGPGLGATARPGPSAPPRSSQVAGVSRGWGDSYAVRVRDSAGRPMVDANVLLVARMADGTEENVAMGALTEPGTYRGTVPTNRSTPVDLRVRVMTDGGFVEIPVRP